MRKKIFTILLALVASVGMMNAKVTWNSSNVSDLNVYATYESYSKEGVTLRGNADQIRAEWYGYGDESMNGIEFRADEPGGFTFSNTLGKNFTKIVMFPKSSGGWDYANLGSGWSFYWDYTDNPATVTWTGNAATVDLLKEASSFNGEPVKSIVFYFEGDSEAPDPTYTVALKAGTVNADKVTLSATSAVEGATVTVTPDEEYEITAFKATYNTTEELSTSFNAETGAYSFTMPAYDVTIEATIALKPVPEGDIFAGFTATAGSGGFDNEGSANLVDNKYISSDWTKWCANDGHKSVPTGESESCWWIDFEASAALNLTGYILTTGNDTGSEHGRNPKNWVLKAKLNADDAWTTIATVTNDVTMKNKSFKDYKFFVDKSGSYQYFRFEVFANQGANVMQLCELRLIGSEASGSDPSDWVLFGDEWDADTKTLTINRQNAGDGNYIQRSEIEHVIISSSVETIGTEICGGCENLIDVTIGANVTSIGTYAFPVCNSLTTVTCEAVTPPSIGENLFYNSSSLAHIYVPAASVATYKAAANWSTYESIISAAGGGSTTDPIVITTTTGQSSYTQGSITVSVDEVGDSDGFYLNEDKSAYISNSGSSTISKIELVPGWFLNKHDQVRANGAEPNSSSEELITFLNVNSNEVTLSCPVAIYIKEVRIYFEEEGGEPEPTPAGNVVIWNMSMDAVNREVEQNETKEVFGGITITVGAWRAFVMHERSNALLFSFSTKAQEGFTFANTLGVNFKKIVLSGAANTFDGKESTGWVINEDKSTITWEGDAASVSIWETLDYIGPVIVNEVEFTLEGGEPAPTVWTALKVGDVIKVGDKIEVPAEDDSWGINYNILRNDWGPYELIRANIVMDDYDDPVVTPAADGAYYVFKAENSDFYPLSNILKGGLQATATSDGLEVTAAENKEFTVAVHDNGGAPTAVENVQTNPVLATKFFRDGQLLIEKNGKIYNVQGVEVK